MTYFILEPEVAGGFGPDAIVDTSVRPVKVTKFHYEFDVWLGDPLLEAIGCFIVTKLLKEKLVSLHPTGVSFGAVEVSKSGQFEDLHPDRKLPEFSWLQVTGEAGLDDFGMSSEHCLVVSERVLDALKQADLSHCDIAEYRTT